MHVGVHHFPDRLTASEHSKYQRSPTLALRVHVCMVFYMGPVDLNSGQHACTVSTHTREPFPKPCVSYFKVAEVCWDTMNAAVRWLRGPFALPGQGSWVAQRTLFKLLQLCFSSHSVAHMVAGGGSGKWRPLVLQSVCTPHLVGPLVLGSGQVLQFSAWVGPETLGFQTW